MHETNSIVLPPNGERYLPEMEGAAHLYHVHRYLVARELVAGRDVLDVACGEGYGSALLASVARSVVGVDIAPEAIEHARAKYPLPNLRFLQGDCAALPLEAASVDVVVSFETIEHHDRHEAMLSEIRRVLWPGGLLVMSTPNRPECSPPGAPANPFHVKELDFEEFAGLLRAYFQHVAFFGQRVVHGSLIQPCDGAGVGFATFKGEEKLPGLPRPLYFLALASDDVLPVVAGTLYEDDGLEAAQALECKLYLSERYASGVQPFGEKRTAAVWYRLNGKPQVLELSFPADLAPLAALRLDIANKPVAIRLHAVTLRQPNGTSVWAWPGGCETFLRCGGVVCLQDAAGSLLLCINDDPQFELAIPEEVLSKVAGGAVLRVEMTAQPLLEVLPEVLGRLAASPLPMAAPAALPVGLAMHVEKLAGVLQSFIARKNALIAQLKAEIEAQQQRQNALYEQLVRAEAQLELLKEFALGRRLERL
ncbi:MAG: class I SAM-dependent methyltransferase [Bryobacteraceae bacterium]